MAEKTKHKFGKYIASTGKIINFIRIGPSGGKGGFKNAVFSIPKEGNKEYRLYLDIFIEGLEKNYKYKERQIKQNKILRIIASSGFTIEDIKKATVSYCKILKNARITASTASQRLRNALIKK